VLEPIDLFERRVVLTEIEADRTPSEAAEMLPPADPVPYMTD
jgi:hypothetical protein